MVVEALAKAPAGFGMGGRSKPLGSERMVSDGGHDGKAVSGGSDVQPEDVARLETEVIAPAGAGQLPQAYRIGPYEIAGVIGKGGMGIVYKARVVADAPVPLGKIVALKMLGDSRLDEQDRRRFDREAAYLQALRHPGIVRVLDIGSFEGRPFLVMQMVEGETLDQILRKRLRQQPPEPLTLDQAADILTQALEALHVAHLAGIVHRDLKPGNIMLTPQGAVKILDFGMAHKVDVDSHLTATGSVLGTPAYMCPEQAAGLRHLVDARSDIYAIGAVCYELVTGKQPFEAENSMAMLRLIIDGELQPPSEHAPDIDHAFETIILKAMARDQRDRYQSAEGMAEDLRRWRSGARIRGRRVNPLVPALRKAYQHRRSLSMAGLILFLVSVGLILTLRAVVTAGARAPDPIVDEVRWEPVIELGPGASQHLFEQDDGAGIRDGTPPFLVRNTLLPEDYRILLLGKVTTHPKISIDVAHLATDSSLELMICSSDVGKGYSLQIVRDRIRGDSLILLRGGPGDEGSERKLVTRQTVDLERPFHLTLMRNHEDGFITVVVDGEEVIAFWDPVPIDGPQNDQVLFAGEPGAAELTGIRLYRAAMQELTKSYQIADARRQYRDYGRAISMYEEFLADAEPGSADERDIRYRLGLCLLAEERPKSYQEALSHFDWVAEQTRSDELQHYHLAAIVQAWVCTLRLERFDEADGYFTELQSHDLNEVLVSVPRETLAKVPALYIERASEALAEESPDELERAMHLFSSAADLAEYLRQDEAFYAAVDGAAQVEMSRDRFPQAAKQFWRLVDHDQLDPEWRDRAQLMLAATERLSRRDTTAHNLYQDLIDRSPPKSLIAQWARLWLGDLLLYSGEAEAAEETWKASPEDRSLPGTIMKNLTHRARQLSFKSRYERHIITFDYFNAVAWLVQGNDHIEQYLEQLSQLRSRWAPGLWPTPLARTILAEYTTTNLE